MKALLAIISALSISVTVLANDGGIAAIKVDQIKMRETAYKNGEVVIVKKIVKPRFTITIDPAVGVLVKGTGGLRKLRMGTKGKGKSGGIRVFYLDIPTKEKCYLLFALEKSESDNISDEEKNKLKELTKLLKK